MALGASLAVVIAIGCGWDPPENSVRFSGYTERFMSRLPTYPIRNVASGNDDWYGREEREKEIGALWDRAEGLKQAAQWDELRKALEQYLRETTGSAKDYQATRNTAQDCLDALTALAQGASGKDVQAYLAARDAFDGGDYGQAAHLLDEMKPPRSLADNIAYLRAAIQYKGTGGSYSDPYNSFAENLRLYPHSEKREANLYMAALSALRAGGGLDESGKGDATDGVGVGADQGDGEARQQHAEATVTKQDWLKTSEQLAQKLVVTYPRGRYADDMRGWLALSWLKQGDQAKALAEYYRLLASENLNTRIEAAFSLNLTRGDADDETLTQVENDLADEPAAAYAYAYHTVYNYLPQVGDSYYDPEQQLHLYDSMNETKEQQERESVLAAKQTGRRRIADFAARLLRHYPNTVTGGSFALRVAMAQMELGQEKEARELAQRALQWGISGEERIRALFVRGVAEHRLKDFKTARRTLARLLQEKLDAPMEERARRVLAIAAEDDGDLGAALEQYFALNYDSDVAYFVDVLMTPEQLAAFVKKHPNHPQHEQLAYSLGVRYLRGGRWEEARQTLRSVHTKRGGTEYYHSDSEYFRNYRPNNPFERVGDDPKDPRWNYGVEYQEVWASLVLRDIKTANDMEHWEKAIAAAPDDDSKAEAIYQAASYLYQSSNLLFYNPIMWGGGRHYLFAEMAASNAYRQSQEAETLWLHLQEHDTKARALPLYLKVAEQFPQSKAAPNALYTAALCHGSLANYNNYWRSMYAQGLHAGPRMVTFQDVRVAYPKYRFPKSERGWEPATHTVNGGPGWDEPPKPGPKPTRYAVWRVRTQRARALLAENFTWLLGGWRTEVAPRLTSVWTGAVSWLIYLLTLLAAYAVARHALPLHRALRAHHIHWPTPASVWRHLRNLSAGLQAIGGNATWLAIQLGADTPRPSWLTVSAAEFGAARRWWTALSTQARRNLGNVVATDALLGLLLLRLIGAI